jgi:hypothetical protein
MALVIEKFVRRLCPMARLWAWDWTLRKVGKNSMTVILSAVQVMDIDWI